MEKSFSIMPLRQNRLIILVDHCTITVAVHFTVRPIFYSTIYMSYQSNFSTLKLMPNLFL